MMNRNVLNPSTTNRITSDMDYTTFNTDETSQEYVGGDEYESDFDEELANHAKVLLQYFNHMYQVSLLINLV